MKRRDLLTATVLAPMLLCEHKTQNQLVSAVTDEKAVTLLKKMQAALGGVDRLAAIRDVDWTVIAKTWNADGAAGPEITRRIRWIRSDLFRKDQHAGRLTVIEFFDGTRGWEVVPDGGFMELKGHELEIIRGEAIGFGAMWLWDHDSRFQVSSGGPGIVRITSSGDPGNADDIAVDPASALPSRRFAASLSGTPATSYHRVRTRTEYVEWQTVDGIKWPHRTANFHDDVKRAEITTTAIKINSGLDRGELSRRPQG